MADGVYKCHDCHMTFDHLNLLQKHKRKFCVGSVGDPDSLLLRKGLRSEEDRSPRPISPDDRPIDDDEVVGRKVQQLRMLKSNREKLRDIRNFEERILLDTLKDMEAQKGNYPQNRQSRSHIPFSNDKEVQDLELEYELLRYKETYEQPKLWAPSPKLQGRASRMTNFSPMSYTSMSIHLPQDDYQRYNPNQDAQLRQLAEDHGRNMEYLQLKNRDLEKQKEDIRRRLLELGTKGRPTGDNTSELLAELRAQEARNAKALDDLKQHLYDMKHQRVNVIKVETLCDNVEYTEKLLDALEQRMYVDPNLQHLKPSESEQIVASPVTPPGNTVTDKTESATKAEDMNEQIKDSTTDGSQTLISPSLSVKPKAQKTEPEQPYLTQGNNNLLKNKLERLKDRIRNFSHLSGEYEKQQPYHPPPPPPPPVETGRKSYVYPVYFGNSLVAEISAMKQAYLQNGGNDPDVLAQMAQMLAEAQNIEDSMKKGDYDNRHREKKGTNQIQYLDMENERLHKELLLLQEQNFKAQERRKTDREDELERQMRRLQEDHLRKLLELQNEIALLKNRSMMEQYKPQEPQTARLPPPAPNNADTPWLLQRPYVEVEQMVPYDQYAGFIIFYDFVLNLDPQVTACRLITGLHSTAAAMGEPTLLPTVYTEPATRATYMQNTSNAVIGARQPVPKCPAQSDLGIVVELQTSGGPASEYDRHSLITRGWTKVPVFDNKGQLFAGKFRIPLRNVPIKPFLHSSQLQNIPKFGDSELFYRVVNMRDAEVQSMLNISAANQHQYRAPNISPPPQAKPVSPHIPPPSTASTIARKHRTLKPVRMRNRAPLLRPYNEALAIPFIDNVSETRSLTPQTADSVRYSPDYDDLDRMMQRHIERYPEEEREDTEDKKNSKDKNQNETKEIDKSKKQKKGKSKDDEDEEEKKENGKADKNKNKSKNNKSKQKKGKYDAKDDDEEKTKPKKKGKDNNKTSEEKKISQKKGNSKVVDDDYDDENDDVLSFTSNQEQRLPAIPNGQIRPQDTTIGFQVDRVKKGEYGEGKVRLTAYYASNGKVVQSSTSPVTCSTTSVKSNFKYGYHIFGQQEATFNYVELQGDIVVIGRFYLRKRAEEVDELGGHEGNLNSEETLVAWAAVPLVLANQSISSRARRTFDHETMRINSGTHTLKLFYPPVPEVNSIPFEEIPTHRDWKRYGKATMRIHIFQGQPRPGSLTPSDMSEDGDDVLPEYSWLPYERKTPLKDPYMHGDGFDIYIDSARFLPDSATFTKVAGRVLDRKYEVHGKDINTGVKIDSDIYNPVYEEKFEFRETNIPPSATLLLKIYTVDNFYKQLTVVGYATLNIFVESGTERQPPVDKPGLAVSLNEGAHQLRLYSSGPNGVDPLTESSLRDVGTRIVPCASILVRLTKVPKGPSGKALEQSKVPEADWLRLGLHQPRPKYTDRIYYSYKCMPSKGEGHLFHSLMRRPNVTIREAVAKMAKAKENFYRRDKNVEDYIRTKLTKGEARPLDVDLTFICQYSPKHGLKVAVDSAVNLPWTNFTHAHLCMNPPGAFYMGPPHATYDKLQFTESLDLKSTNTSPSWRDGYKHFPRRSFHRFLTVIIHLQEVQVTVAKENYKYGLLEQAWTALQVFTDKYSQTATFQLPLFQGSPNPQMLKQLAREPCREWMERNIRSSSIFLIEGASVFVRLADGRRDDELQGTVPGSHLLEVNTDYIPPDLDDVYSKERPGKPLDTMVPPGKTPDQFIDNLALKFKNLVYKLYEESNMK